MRAEERKTMIKDKLTRVRLVLACAVLAALLASLISVSSASAEATACSSCTPWWRLNLNEQPTILPPGGKGEIAVLASDLGDAGPRGSAIVLTDRLPAGLTVQEAKITMGVSTFVLGVEEPAQCTVQPHEVVCTIPEEAFYSWMPRAYSHIEMRIMVAVSASAGSGEVNQATISGGGAAAVSGAHPITVSSTPVRFGLEQYELTPENADGSIDTQAGSHPFQLTSTIMLNQAESAYYPPEEVKDLRFNLPPGLIGNPTPFPQCTLAKFTANPGNNENLCSSNTAIGVASVTLAFPGFSTFANFEIPLFNLVPSRGEPARFGFDVWNSPVYLDTAVDTGGEHNIVVSVNNITEIAGLVSSRVTFWGVPGDPRHDTARGWSCLSYGSTAPECLPTSAVNPPPFLGLPTSCEGPFRTTAEADSWTRQDAFTSPLEYKLEDNLGRQLEMTGCNRLPFGPTISVVPDTQAGSTPSGLGVDIHVPQDGNVNGTSLAESDVKDTTVALPVGMALNPSAADGLLSCSEEQVALQAHAAVGCPEASKVGTVEIRTPLLPNPLAGGVYLATQDANPFGSLVAMYIAAEDPVSGTVIKVAGQVTPDPVTGQLVARFDETPQLPFEDLKLHFFGGSRAPLATPAKCGSYTTAASIEGWSGNAPSEPSSSFQVTSGPNGSACASPLPFSPSLTAGSTNIQTGAFSPFTMTMSRADGQQSLRGIVLHMPPGLLGVLSNVKLCEEPQADAGTCGSESEIGETIVSVGLGGDPFSVRGGRVYITGPYKGAPYGLSIVNPAKAGPFDLGQIVVRAKIEVDPTTAQLTVATDESGPYAIPQILDGIPLEIQHINVTINRPQFTFNPTNCSPMAVTAQLNSSEGASGSVSEPFQVTNCANLAFKPQFKVATQGRTSRANGASLDVKLSYPKAAWGTQANIKSVKVELPKQLPSRLSTLQKACPSAVFQANPATCPAGSLVGTGTATTPIIPVPLTGPAYFVSNGGAKFPELVIVLSGYGVTVELHGETFISRAGITSSTFRTVPDVPIGSFELSLPEGPNSALAANGNLCRSTLAMPTAFIAQNGAAVNQSTRIAVSGCSKSKASPRARKLAAALKACRKRVKRKQANCESAARRRYAR
jgi:hypothetical protein